MFYKKLLFCLPIVLSHTVTFSQVKLSHGLQKGYPFSGGEAILSSSVKDLGAFLKKYEKKVKVLHVHATMKAIDLTECDQSIFEELKADSNVVFIDHHKPAKEEATFDHLNSNFNRLTKAHANFPSILGANLKISIKEQNFDTTDIDLWNRSFRTSITPTTSSQHATNMATLIAGAGNSSWRALGAVPHSNFTASDFSSVSPDDISIFISNNIHLQNHSYGVGIENYYGIEAAAYDQQVFQNPTLLHVFSSGNSGQLQPTAGTYQNLTFANLTGNFKQAKNVLVVNAVDTTLLINTLNSRGPAFDGRVKPELTAFGQGGTSEAAALGSGISALVQEKYVSSYNQLPDASMVKAILIASADDIGPKGIDYLYGYGNINAYKALQLIQFGQIATFTFLSGTDQFSLPITIPASVSELKIAIAWSDPSATVNSNSVLVNDIDGWLDDGSNTTLPWVLNPYPQSDSLLALPKRKEDHLNNIEYITLSNPPAGSYQLHLKSGALTGSQPVSVAYWISDQTQFNWDFPDSTQIAAGGKKNLLTWQAAPDQIGDLYLQLNQGAWQLIKSGIDLNKYFYWTPPSVLAKAKLKIIIGASEFSSDEFLISPELNMTTAFNCADSIGLAWNSSSPATAYEIYTMGSEYLTKISTTSDTLKVLPASSNQFFSVAPVLNGKTGLKSQTINYTQQGAFCYFNLFAAERFSATQIKVQLTLSSWHAVDHIVIHKSSGGVTSAFRTILPSSPLASSFYDTELIPGVMTYQAELFFKNGLTLFSDPIDIPIEAKGKALIYPNPVSSESDLNIISTGGVTFRILDLYGRAVLEKDLELVQDAIDVISLPSGLYVFQLLSGDHVTDTGRFVKY